MENARSGGALPDFDQRYRESFRPEKGRPPMQRAGNPHASFERGLRLLIGGRRDRQAEILAEKQKAAS